MTEGGTMSIILSCKTHREWAHALKGVTEPELIMPITAHPAYEKAAELLRIKVVKVKLDKATLKVNLRKV